MRPNINAGGSGGVARAMHTQPVITITSITTLVSAVIAAIALVTPIPPTAEAVIIALVTAAWPLVTAAWTWHKVYAPSSVERISDEQYQAGVPPVEPQPNIPPPADANAHHPLRPDLIESGGVAVARVYDPNDPATWPNPPTGYN